ncbi:MAG: chromosome segregation protein SMC [Candidatus Bathyarchaeota archaeon]|nr:chromosome segregation protein SMC [Candidatus Bathyarchaeota archaeon]
MPYIKKIEVKGFKSFGPKTVKVNLDKGFTAITGPNGSGKTNILDAALFALGELSSRRMRAENASKLIFHGSEKAGLQRGKKAKVIIQFDNSDGIMPVDTHTVTVSREVFRNGQSVYRLNGRRLSRTHILEILSMAAIGSSSQNIIPQGTITRLTDITPMERRRIIEDLVGIAQYDSEKADAENKLRTADISIRTAMGRIDEVQKRVDDLERERNGLLRYNFIQNEIKKFQAVKISHEITQINKKIEKTSAQVKKVGKKVEKFRALREAHRSKRREIEGDWRKLSSEIMEEGGSQVLKVQIKIGEQRSSLTELNTKISSGKASLESLNRVKENTAEQFQSIRNEIKENRIKIRKLQKTNEKIQLEIKNKESEHEALATETAQLWGGLGDNNKRIRQIEEQIQEYYRKLANLRSEYLKDQNVIQLTSRRKRELEERKTIFIETSSELEKSLIELEKVQKEQKTQLKNLEHIIEKRKAQREAVKTEISEAGKIANSAKAAVIEFVTQRELAETVAAEERGLRSIEELNQVGGISGVYGRLKTLIKVDRDYTKAVSAAAIGWLNALVVKDFDTAFTCTETLRKMKLGRIKIIPIQGTSKPKKQKIPNRRGVIGIVSDVIKYGPDLESAVNFVFGDTLIVTDDKTAFSLSSQGHRVVTKNGDLYEAGGAFESGYYRAPIDFSKIIPSQNAITSLDEAVNSLQQHLSQRDGDILIFEEEIERTKIESARLYESIITLDKEISRVKRSVKRTNKNVNRVEKYILKIEKEIEDKKIQIGVYRSERNSIQKEEKKLKVELEELRSKTDLAHIQELEIQREKTAEDIINLRKNLGTVQTELATIRSQLDNVLEVGYQNSKIQLSKIKQQERKTEKIVETALKQQEILKTEIIELEKNRKELSKAVLSAREESKKFTTQIDSIDSKLQKLDDEYEETESLLNQLKLSVQTNNLHLQQYQEQLNQIGFENPLETNTIQLEEAETTIQMMRFELERIGAVNQLASTHYAEQISRYKELSLRLNELEREKQAIVKFMEEIESKKRKVFLSAFEKININLKNYFSKLTGGGAATLNLANPDDPFQGGIDMLVQFPDKPYIVVSGASGGERSVAAVAFIFALKEFNPASFYILDEVDAHLDAFHTAKLADLLLEESEKTQFIVITLRAELVNKAQKIFGVFEQNGVSSILSPKSLRRSR